MFQVGLEPTTFRFVDGRSNPIELLKHLEKDLVWCPYYRLTPHISYPLLLPKGGYFNLQP